MPYSPIGQSIQELDTPALLIDLDKMENNIQKMAARCRDSGLHWRPHAKGHKTPAIAHEQLHAGAIGITCAKLGEAEVLADAGISDILVANQVVGREKSHVWSTCAAVQMLWWRLTIPFISVR